MIRIIKDPDRLYDSSIDIGVVDSDTYVKSRLLIDEVKKGLKDNATIAIYRPSYFKYYEDLYNIPNWVETIEYTVKSIISAHGLSFDDKEIERIEFFIKESDIVNFFKSYNKSTSLELNLLNYIFDNGEEIQKISSYEEFIIWMEKSLQRNKAEWKGYKYKELIEDNINIELKGDFFNKLLSIDTITDLEKFKSSLVATYLFFKYRSSSKNIIKSKIEIFDEMYVSEGYIKNIIDTSEEIIEELNFIVSTMKEKMSIFDTSKLDEFLNLTKGYLDEEWNWVWNYLMKNFRSEDFSQNLSKVYLWVNIDKAKHNINILMELLNFKEEKDSFGLPKNIGEWYSYYQYFYLKWFSPIDESKNIIEMLKKINEGFLSDTITEINEYKDQIDDLYKNYLYENYNELLRSGETNIKVLESIHGYVDKNKILFFIIDGCRWELWEIIKSIFEKNQYYIENEKQFCLSAIPSITSISRTSLVTGKTFQALMNEKVGEEFSFDILNEEKHIKRIYPNKTAAFKNGGLKDLEELLYQNSDIYVFIYSDGDALFHAVENMTIKAIEPLIENLIDGIIQSTKNCEDLLILFGTDHGSTKGNDKEKLLLDVPPNIMIEQHGNSIKLSDYEFNEGDLIQLKKKIDNEKFYTIWREELYRYGLPNKINKREIYGWVFPKSSSYYGRKPKGFIHGGFSMEETIIPCGIFRKQQSTFKELMIEVGNRNLALDDVSYIDIILFNPNNFRIKKIVMDMPNVKIKEVINDLLSKDKKKIKIQFKLNSDNCRDNYFKELIKLDIYYLNNKIEQNYKLLEKVEVKTVNAINEEISKKRTLDF